MIIPDVTVLIATIEHILFIVIILCTMITDDPARANSVVQDIESPTLAFCFKTIVLHNISIS